jgi:hypothetical protein
MRFVRHLATVALVAPAVVAQELPPIVSDRPDFTESAETVPRAHVQLEGGVTSERADDSDALTVGELLARVGLSPRWELRVGAPTWERIDPDGAADASGFGDPSLGAKLRLTDPEGDGVAAAVIFGTTLAAGDEEIGADDAEPFVNLALSRDVSPSMALAGNAGYTRASDPEGSYGRVSASLSLGVALTATTGAFVEAYGFSEEAKDGDTSTYADGGVTWLVRPELQLDARIGTGLSGNDVDLFAGVGFVRRW